jgi:TRAP-type C4-dicarboxylate transport system substrate-binding protein
MYTLGFYENEFRAVSNSKRAIKTVEDVKGLKLRVPGSQAIQGIFEELGAQTTAIPFPELYTALEQGTVDGQDNGVLLSYDSKFQEAQEFITLTNHVYATGSLVINDGKWSSLTEDQQEAIQKAADEALQEQIKSNRQRIDEVVKSLKEEGVKVNELSEEEMNRFKEIAQNVWVEMVDVYGKERIDQLKEEVNNLK